MSVTESWMLGVVAMMSVFAAFAIVGYVRLRLRGETQETTSRKEAE